MDGRDSWNSTVPCGARLSTGDKATNDNKVDDKLFSAVTIAAEAVIPGNVVFTGTVDDSVAVAIGKKLVSNSRLKDASIGDASKVRSCVIKPAFGSMMGRCFLAIAVAVTRS